MSRARADFNRATRGHTQRIEPSKIRARSRLLHSSSHRPALVFHDPFCPKNAGAERRTDRRSTQRGQPASVGRPVFEPPNFFPASDRTLARACPIESSASSLPGVVFSGIPGASASVQSLGGGDGYSQRSGWRPEIDCEQRRHIVWSPCRCSRSRQLFRRENNPRSLCSPSPSRIDDWVLSLVGDSDETER